MNTFSGCLVSFLHSGLSYWLREWLCLLAENSIACWLREWHCLLAPRVALLAGSESGIACWLREWHCLRMCALTAELWHLVQPLWPCDFIRAFLKGVLRRITQLDCHVGAVCRMTLWLSRTSAVCRMKHLDCHVRAVCRMTHWLYCTGAVCRITHLDCIVPALCTEWHVDCRVQALHVTGGKHYSQFQLSVLGPRQTVWGQTFSIISTMLWTPVLFRKKW